MRSGKTPSVQDYFAELRTPDINEMELQLEELISQGTLSPEEAQTIMLEQSSMNNITLDPKLKQAQMDALSQLQEIGSSGGLNAQSRARLAQIENQENAANRGNREALMNRFAAQGMGGSGLEMASQLQNQQDSASRRSSRDLEIAALAEKQALDAIMQGGQLGGQMRGQDFSEQSQIAQANDAISRFNAQNSQQQINQNVNARNAAQEANLMNKQNLANQNVGLRNQAQQNNKGLIQQNFQNEMAKRGGQAGIAQNNAQAQGANSAAKANAFNQTVGTGLTIGGYMAGGPAGGMAARQGTNALMPQNDEQYNQTQWRNSGGLIHGENTNMDTQPAMLTPGEMVIKKEDVPRTLKAMHTNDKGEFDVDSFLDMVTGYKYGYSKKGK
jgi:hypothetical protein